MQAHAETDIETVYIEQGYGPSISAHTFFLSITESKTAIFAVKFVICITKKRFLLMG